LDQAQVIVAHPEKEPNANVKKLMTLAEQNQSKA
jgi:hypothetical protein